MSIQQNINQLATIGTALYTQSPQFEATKQEKVEQRLEKEAGVRFIKSIDALIGAAETINDPIAKVNLTGDVKEAALDLYKRTGNPEFVSEGYNVAHTLQQKYVKELTGMENAQRDLSVNKQLEQYRKSTLGNFYSALKENTFVDILKEKEDGKSVK